MDIRDEVLDELLDGYEKPESLSGNLLIELSALQFSAS